MSKHAETFGLAITRIEGGYQVSIKEGNQVIGNIERHPSYGWVDRATKKWLSNNRDGAAGALYVGHQHQQTK